MGTSRKRHGRSCSGQRRQNTKGEAGAKRERAERGRGGGGGVNTCSVFKNQYISVTVTVHRQTIPVNK